MNMEQALVKSIRDYTAVMKIAEIKGIEQGVMRGRREEILENLREIAPVTNEIIKIINEESNTGNFEKNIYNGKLFRRFY